MLSLNLFMTAAHSGLAHRGVELLQKKFELHYLEIHSKHSVLIFWLIFSAGCLYYPAQMHSPLKCNMAKMHLAI
jgi:hypothetical protein